MEVVAHETFDRVGQANRCAKLVHAGEELVKHVAIGPTPEVRQDASPQKQRQSIDRQNTRQARRVDVRAEDRCRQVHRRKWLARLFVKHPPGQAERAADDDRLVLTPSDEAFEKPRNFPGYFEQ